MAKRCAGVLLAGCAGFVLRKLQWVAYDSQRELFTGNALFVLPLFVLLAAVALVGAGEGKRLSAQKATRSFYCPQTLYIMLMVTSAFLFALAGMLGLMSGLEQLTLWRHAPDQILLTQPMSVLLCGLLCLPSAAAVLLMGKEGYRGSDRSLAPVLSTLPAFTGVIWLFATHMEHSTDPVLLRYGILLGAVFALTLAAYDVAGFYQQQYHPVRFPFFCILSVVLGITALADKGLAWFHICLLCAFVIMVLAQFYAYLDPEEYIPTDSHTEDE